MTGVQTCALPISRYNLVYVVYYLLTFTVYLVFNSSVLSVVYVCTLRSMHVGIVCVYVCVCVCVSDVCVCASDVRKERFPRKPSEDGVPGCCNVALWVTMFWCLVLKVAFWVMYFCCVVVLPS